MNEWWLEVPGQDTFLKSVNMGREAIAGSKLRLDSGDGGAG